MKVIKVLKKEGEKIRKNLIQKKLLNKDFPIQSDEKHVFLPINELTSELKNKFQIIEKKFQKLIKEEKNLINVLKNELKSEELEKLPKSMDIIGDIAIIELPKELEKKEKKIANAILKIHKNIKVITKKYGIHSGQFRTRKVKIIGGEKRKETIHKENNIKLKLNIETCYFSPRLATERKRINNLIKPQEEILVMFSGVCPYPINISKNTQAKKIIGIEINPEAHKYAKENLKLNKTKNIEIFKGDVREIVPKLNQKFDRIIMPLPKSAEEFLPTALLVSKKNTKIHLYNFLHENDIPNKAIKEVHKYIKKCKILKVIKCGQYSPGKYRTCTDIIL